MRLALNRGSAPHLSCGYGFYLKRTGHPSPDWPGAFMSKDSSLATDCGRPYAWSLFELCLFDQARGSLRQQGFDIETEFGLTDEQEPWFVFCDQEGHVIGHFARLGDTYVSCVPFEDKGTTGDALSDVLRDFLQRLTPPDHVRTLAASAIWLSGIT
jgi:hypothetical protein